MSVTSELMERLAPWMTPDLEGYIRAIGSMYEEMEQFTDDVNGESFSILFDPDLCPEGALDWLAQFPGERLPRGLAVPLKRERIRDRANQLRGTKWSYFAAAQRSLTGNRLVSIVERDGVGGTDDPDRITVITYVSETPNPAQVEADLWTVHMADIVLNYQVLTGQTWTDVRDGYATWRAVMDDPDVTTWADVASATPSDSFSRPRP